MSAEEVDARLGRWQRGWLLGFRDVARPTDERTAIFSLLPWAGMGNNLPIPLLSQEKQSLRACLLATLDTDVLDYVTRHKLAGVSMTFIARLPVVPPDSYAFEDLRLIAPRAGAGLYPLGHQTLCRRCLERSR